MHTPGDLLAAILFTPAAGVKKCKDQLKRTTGDLRAGIAKFTEVDGEVLRITIVNCQKFGHFELTKIVIKTLN